MNIRMMEMKDGETRLRKIRVTEEDKNSKPSVDASIFETAMVFPLSGLRVSYMWLPKHK